MILDDKKKQLILDDSIDSNKAIVYKHILTA